MTKPVDSATTRASSVEAEEAQRKANARRFLDLFQRYVVEYATLHKPITPELMVDDYDMRFGDFRIKGRDSQYRELVVEYFKQFPKMAVTVHDLITNGDRVAFRYTEHGRDAYNNGAYCAWSGVSLYKWDGSRFTQNSSEQDWYTREQQGRGGVRVAVESPAVSPWETDPQPSNPQTEAAVRAWISSGALTTTKGVLVDDEWLGNAPAQIVDQQSVTEVDLFSAGDAVALHIEQHGKLLPDFASDPRDIGKSVTLTIAGIVRVKFGRVVQGALIRNRAGLKEALLKGAQAG